ncbi:hypothetical protein PV328_007249 [Microctonus aethiopoides]|uniref:Uncharacterized protein n=1 Tax=Microctonus aethiopoides TaxID=144406 RepID=A0AA39FRH1_9HYME|nr:hypothetical protein PV328_007249 [Microctonus aethiopoides]
MARQKQNHRQFFNAHALVSTSSQHSKRLPTRKSFLRRCPAQQYLKETAEQIIMWHRQHPLFGHQKTARRNHSGTRSHFQQRNQQQLLSKSVEDGDSHPYLEK